MSSHERNILSIFLVYQGENWKIMQLIDENIRADVIKKYGQYTKRVNGQMIKGKPKSSF